MFPSVSVDRCWNRTGVWGKGQDRCKRLAHLIHCRNCEVYVNAGRSLLDREPSAEYVREMTRSLAGQKEPPAQGQESALVFRIGSEWLGLPCACVCEVARMAPVHSLPRRTGGVIKGVVNIRGKLEICVSLGRLLQIQIVRGEKKRNRFSFSERLLVAEDQAGRYVFPVSEIQGLTPYRTDTLAPVPSTVARSRASYTLGVLELEGREIGLLDSARLFRDLAERLS